MTSGEDSHSQLVCVSGVFLFTQSCYNTGGLAVHSDLVFSVESIDFCGIAPSEIGVIDEGLVLDAG